MAQQYYSGEDLARFSEIGKNVPDLAAKFFDWYGAVFAEGALSVREKSIIAAFRRQRSRSVREPIVRRDTRRAGAGQTLNDSPHPHESCTLGLLNLNPTFRPSRAK